jgi:hypothetical protein
MPLTCGISEARQHRAAVAPGDAVAFVDEVEMRIEMHDVDRLLVRIGCDRRHGDGVVAAEDVRHRPGIEQCPHRELGVCKATFGVGVDDVAVARVDNLDFVGGQVGHLVLEVEHAFRTEAVEHRHLPDGARPEAGADAIARCCVDRDAEHGDVGAIELVPVCAGGLSRESGETHERQIHALRHVAALAW